MNIDEKPLQPTDIKDPDDGPHLFLCTFCEELPVEINGALCERCINGFTEDANEQSDTTKT